MAGPTKEKSAARARTRKLTIKHKKKVIKTSKKVSGSFRLLGQTLRHLWQNKRLFGAIVAVYAVLYFLLVKGLAANFQLDETRQALEEAVSGDIGRLATASTLFGALVGSGGSVSEAGSVYQVALFIVISLAVIRALRQTFSGRDKPSLRAVFYGGMYPLIPYVLVGLVILLQLVPALIGVTIYGIVSSNGIAVGAIEQVLWFLVLIMACGLSLYLVSASILASYIVTLPDMTPMKALRSARKLVRFRRFMVIRKVLFLPVAMLVCAAVIFFPLVLYATAFAEPLFLLFMLFILLVAHTYSYLLYRELL